MKHAAQQGLTIIEVLIALMMFMIVSVSVMAIFPTVFKSNARTLADQTVTVAAKDYLEKVRISFTNAANFDAGALPTAPSSCNATVSSGETMTIGLQARVITKRVKLTCTPNSQPAQTFWLELGRDLSQPFGSGI